MATMKTLTLEAVVRKGEKAPRGMRDRCDAMRALSDLDWFYRPRVYSTIDIRYLAHDPLPGNADPDEIAGIGWMGVARVWDPTYLPSYLLPYASEPHSYVYAVDDEDTEYLWSFDPAADAFYSDLRDFYRAYVVQIAKEIRRIREGAPR